MNAVLVDAEKLHVWQGYSNLYTDYSSPFKIIAEFTASSDKTPPEPFYELESANGIIISCPVRFTNSVRG